MKAFGYLSLVALASQAAAGVIAARDDSVALPQDSVALPEVHFSEEAVLAQTANRTVIPCESPDNCPEEHALDKRRQSPYSACAQANHYVSSRCITAHQLQVTCRLRNAFGNLGVMNVNIRVLCNVPHEVCIQNNQDPPYALCQDLTSLVIWSTSPQGGNTKNTRYYHSSNKNQQSYAINNYFDRNSNPINVGNTYFYTEPGKQFNNFIMAASVAATKGVINWLRVQNIRTDVYTGGAGGLTVHSFVMT